MLFLDCSLTVPVFFCFCHHLSCLGPVGRSFCHAITLEHNSGDTVGDGGDDNVDGYIPTSSKKRHRTTDGHRCSSERVESHDRAADETDKARHRKKLAAWEAAHEIDDRLAKLSSPDSDDEAEADLLWNPFSSHSFAPGGLSFTSTQGVVCSASTANGEANSIASILVPDSVTLSLSIASTKLPIASSAASVISQSPALRKRPSYRYKCVQPVINEESSTKSSDGEGEETVAEAMVPALAQTM